MLIHNVTGVKGSDSEPATIFDCPYNVQWLEWARKENGIA
jgi:hypothetical protein